MKRMNPIAIWLWITAAMIFVMVVIGGLTRLTESGLSIVDWRPVTGWFPPLSQEAWMTTFDAYKTSPEYQEINAGMVLSEFKQIFWLEYIHRLWGRLIGLVFVIPALYFIVRGAVSGWMGIRLALILLLGASQGVLGWYMVQSGLADQPWVSPYRLVAHFGLALAVYSLVIWTALEMGSGPIRPVLTMTTFLLFFGFIVVLSGAAVAGTDAGLTYNTFPMMDGYLVPPQIWDSPVLLENVFEDIRTVQFNHRLLATLVAISVLLTWIGRRMTGQLVGKWGNSAVFLTFVQYGLGIATLLSVVAIPLASAHQAVGTLLITVLVGWAHADSVNIASTGKNGQDLGRMDGKPVAG